MIEINSYIVYGQDGESINKDIMDYFSLAPGDMKFDKKSGQYVYDFVGFVFRKEKILAVFPKHYFKVSDISRYNVSDTTLEEDIQLLFNAIDKYSENEGSRVKADTYLGSEENYESDYPFQAFFKVYDYFRKYGLYKEQEEIIKPGSNGKVSWKKTIQKSQILVSGDNILFSPLYMKKNTIFTNFITECMGFIIDYTIEHFNIFFTLPKTMHRRNKFDYFENIEYVIKKLYEIKANVYKDITKELIDNMVTFFKQYQKKCRGGNIHVKVNYFNLVWENAVNEYLNSYFSKVDSTTNSIVFDKSQKKSSVHFSKMSYLVDMSGNKFEIELDHYGVDAKNLYIFDSKYYYYLKSLNYKQYAYDEILRYSRSGINNLYSVLILPGDKSTGIHFELERQYQGTRTYGNKITEQYLGVKEVLTHYIKA